MLVKDLLKKRVHCWKGKLCVLYLLEFDVNRNFVLVGETVLITGETCRDTKTCQRKYLLKNSVCA